MRGFNLALVPHIFSQSVVLSAVRRTYIIAKIHLSIMVYNTNKTINITGLTSKKKLQIDKLGGKKKRSIFEKNKKKNTKKKRKEKKKINNKLV